MFFILLSSIALLFNTQQKTKTTPPKRKRRRTDGSNEFLPDGPSDDDEEQGDWDFSEVLDEEVNCFTCNTLSVTNNLRQALKLKTAVINRAPVMMAWATLVAEKMHFLRAEALSIGGRLSLLRASRRPLCRVLK